MEVKSYCRICAGLCGLVVTVEDNRVVAVRPDREHPASNGFICTKGLQYPEMHHGRGRLRQPRRRRSDGSYETIASEAALDDVAARLSAIIANHGTNAVAMFYGTGVIGNLPQLTMALAFMAALKSPSVFCTMTIDQSAKWVAQGRLGSWAAGRPSYDDADVWLISGSNPLVSLNGQSFGMSPLDPVKRMKASRQRGLKLIVVDPVETETARYASLFLQPLPGEDPVLFAAIIRHILSEGWHDADFCAQYVQGLDGLAAALEPFTPDYAAARCGVPAAKIRAAAEMFARDSSRGMAGGGTGPDMGPFSNLAEHLIETLNVICGRFPRAGDTVRNTGVLTPPREYRAEVIPPGRSWEQGHKSRIGNYGTLHGTMMTNLLAEEILLPGEGQIHALFCVGANPAAGLPNQERAVKALEALELLVTAEPRLAQTARLASHVFAPTHAFERPGHSLMLEAYAPLGVNFAQYSPALISPEPGMDVIDDWYLYWALAKRLKLQLNFAGTELDMETPPTTDQLLELLARHAQVPLAEVKRHPQGKIFDRPTQTVLPPRPGVGARFDLAPADVRDELTQLLATTTVTSPYTHRLICRRERAMMNTADFTLAGVRRQLPYNPAHMHGDDLAELGLEDGDEVEIISPAGAIPAIVKADGTVRRGAISMSHGWGALPGEEGDYRQVGSSTCQLVTSDRQLESINAMPRMSAIPVRVAVPGRGPRQPPR